MFKNFIIIVQFFIIFSLMVQKPDNAKIIIQDLATAKGMVVDGAEYLHKTFDKEFSVHSDEVFEKEHGNTMLPSVPIKPHKLEGSKSNYTPIPNTHLPRVFDDGKNAKIIEETWYDEK